MNTLKESIRALIGLAGIGVFFVGLFLLVDQLIN